MVSFEITEENVVFMDNHLLIVNKPHGLLVHPDKEGNDSLEDAAKEYIRKKFNKTGNVFATAAHRLDRPVAGLVIIARTSKALARMNALFAERKIAKVYLAVVEGKPEPEKHLRHWIKKNEQTNKVWTYTYERGDARQADLKYWLVGKKGDHSLLLVRLFTGRHHQIRAQLGLEKIPIAGDVKYGNPKEGKLDISLFSYACRFVHPVTKLEVTFAIDKPGGIFREFPIPDQLQLEEALTAELVFPSQQ